MFSQVKLSGVIADNQNRGIQNASVSLLDETDNFLGYNFTDENGNYSITFEKQKNSSIKIEISCLFFALLIYYELAV